MPGTETAATTHVPWWRDAVCYQVYVRSFADSDGDGLGDLAGVTSRLPYVADLGVDAIWLNPFYASPQHDHGYDVADYRAVDARFGTLDDFDAMLAEAHRLGLKVIVDLVPNHTSSDHAWFREAIVAAPGSPARDRYVFRDGRGLGGVEPPNDWQSVFGGSAWAQVPDGQWYLHLFDRSQPDLNWEHPEVRTEFESVLRFWLDRGADGFRIDVAHGMIKKPGLPDEPATQTTGPYWNQPGVHEIYRAWHRILAEYPGERMAIAEAWAPDEETLALYIRDDELQQAFNFHWLQARWSATAFRRVIEQTFAATEPAGASPTWVLENHDVDRVVSRYGGGRTGVARAKAATLAMLGLPGSAYVYQGQELGLPQVDVPDQHKQDPQFFRGGGTSRDGCRVPMPWWGTSRPYGFSPEGSDAPWLPQPTTFRTLSVEAQESKAGSTLAFYREALRVRREVTLDLSRHVDLPKQRRGVLTYHRDPGFTCVVNCSSQPVAVDRLGVEGEPVIASQKLRDVRRGQLPPDTCAWFVASS